MTASSLPLLPSILLFGGGLIFGLLVAFAIVMFKQNQILKKATAPSSPPNKNNSLTKKDNVEVTIEDEVRKQTTQNLNAPMKPSEKRRRAKASTKAINVHMRKRTDEKPFSTSKTKSTGSSSNSIGEEAFEKRLSNGPKVLPGPGPLQNSATPISKRKHVRTGMHETPEKLVKALKECAGSNEEGIIHAVFGRCDVADKNKLELIEEGAVPAILEFLNPNYSTHTRKTAAEYLLGLRKFGTAHEKIIQELSAPSSLSTFASYMKSLTHEETTTFPQIARLYLACLYKQQKEGKTPYIEIHDFMVNAATTWMTRADIHEENNVKTLTAAVDIASEILNESQPKLFGSNAEGKLATVDLLSIAIHRLTFSLKLYAKPLSHNDQVRSSKWAFLNSWSGDFADGESAHKNELMDLLKRFWQCASILARDEKIHVLMLDPNRHLIDNMRLAVRYFHSGAIYVQTPQSDSLCERFLDALIEFSKSEEGLKAVETMKDVLLVPLTTSKQGGEPCANRANDILKKLGTPAKTPSKIHMKTPEKLPPQVLMIQEKDVLSLASLSSDIIRKIVGHIPEETDGMQLISQEWNSIVREFRMRHRGKLPLIDSFSFRSYQPGTICLTIQRRYLRYFRVESEYHQGVYQTSKVAVYLPVAERDANGSWKLMDRINDRLAFIFERTSKIDFLDFSFKTTSYHEIVLLLPQFSCVPVRICRAVVGSFMQGFRSSILNIVRSNKIEMLEIIGTNIIDFEAIYDFITSTIQFVILIKIYNEPPSNGDYQWDVMFCGRPDAFWNEFSQRIMDASRNIHAQLISGRQTPYLAPHICVKRIN